MPDDLPDLTPVGSLRLLTRVEWGDGGRPPADQLPLLWAALSAAEREVLSLAHGLAGADPLDPIALARHLRVRGAPAAENLVGLAEARLLDLWDALRPTPPASPT